MGGCSSLSFDFHFFGSVIEQPDANMVETEVLLNLIRDLAQHVARIVARDGGARETYETPSCRERRCSSANNRAFSTATDTCPAAVTSTSRSRCSKTNSRSGFIATMIPEALFPIKMGTAIRHLAGRFGTWLIPRRFRAASRIGADKQGLSGADNVFGKSISRPPGLAWVALVHL